MGFQSKYMRLVPLGLCLLATLAGCKGSSSVGANRGTGASDKAAQRTIAAETLKQKGGLCDDNRRISNPDPDSPEWLIWRAYELAQQPDSDATFAEFRKLFPASHNTRDLRELKWGRIRANVHKFAVTPGKPDFVICRTMPTDQGTKYYIQTSDPRQTPPPITVGESDGKQRILFFTPF
jgi:hypothetical protein